MSFFSNFFKKKKFSHLRRSPKIFIPTPSPWWIIIPFKPLSIVLIIILAGFCIYLALRSDIFLIRNLIIEVENEPLDGGQVLKLVNEEKIREKAKKYLTHSVFTTKVKDLEKEILEQFLEVRSAKVYKELPDKLVILVQSRTPVAKVLSEEGEFLVDDTGLIFYQDPPESTLPLFKLSFQDLKLGEVLDPQKVSSVLEIINNWKKIEGENLVHIEMDENGDICVLTSANVKVIFSPNKKIELQVTSLQTILLQAKMEGWGLTQVDLRYENPVVKY